MILNKLIISVIGEDRPGILAAVSDLLYARGCNIEDVSQTILQSVFGALFIVSTTVEMKAEQLQAVLTEGVSKLNLDVFVRKHEFVTHETVLSQPFVITTFGPDKPGLVRGITGILARHTINVSNLKAVFKGGDDPGNNVMIFEVDVPIATSLPDLRRELKQAAQELGLEINIQHRKIFEMMNRI
ncbi:MAG: amino acid-binding protein [Gammaproteobacteria bacterium]|nr:amino acid-binding protein [Gammaproteobacteria bacterium]